MSNTTNTKQRDLLHTQENVENNPNSNSPLIEREPIGGTPFTLIHRNKEWFIVMGDYRLTEPTETRDTTLEKLEYDNWDIIMQMIVIAVKKTNEIQKIEEKLEMPDGTYIKEKPDGVYIDENKPYETESL